MPSSERTLIPLFPLPLALVPGEVVPLHIFEERYKRLIAECRAGGGEFGVLLQQKDVVAGAGCTARMVEVIEEFEDGRLNLLVEGRRRFRLLEVVEPADPEGECLHGQIEYFGDLSAEAALDIQEKAVALFLRMLALMDVESPRRPVGEEPLSFLLAAAVDFGVALKQQLLESISETERLETLVTVIETLIPRLELRRDREEAIRGNGKGV
jgi:ATP-dependent Lon protease